MFYTISRQKKTHGLFKNLCAANVANEKMSTYEANVANENMYAANVANENMYAANVANENMSAANGR